jgi:hypothetical protein
MISQVHDSTADMRYLVLPERPAGTEVSDSSRKSGMELLVQHTAAQARPQPIARTKSSCICLPLAFAWCVCVCACTCAFVLRIADVHVYLLC